MTTSHLFEDFGGVPKEARASSSLGIEEVEDQKLQAFENGYQAGWDDAIRAQSDNGQHVSAGLAASLQETSLEVQEMRESLTSSVQAIMAGVVNTVLPAMARESLGAHICEQVLAMTKGQLERSIEVAVAPEAEDVVRSLLTDEATVASQITADDLLAPTQALLRFGKDEREINLDDVLAEIAQSVTAFFDSQNSEVTDG